MIKFKNKNLKIKGPKTKKNRIHLVGKLIKLVNQVTNASTSNL